MSRVSTVRLHARHKTESVLLATDLALYTVVCAPETCVELVFSVARGLPEYVCFNTYTKYGLVHMQ